MIKLFFAKYTNNIDNLAKNKIIIRQITYKYIRFGEK